MPSPHLPAAPSPLDAADFRACIASATPGLRDVWGRKSSRLAIHRSKLRSHALHLPDITCRCATIPCAYQVLRQDYSQLRSSRSGQATALLTARNAYGHPQSRTEAPRLYPDDQIPGAVHRPTPWTCNTAHHDIHRQDERSRYRRSVSRAKMCAVAGRSAELVDTMSPCYQHVSRLRYPRLRPKRTASATDPLSAATAREQSLCVMTVKADPSLHGPTAPTATRDEPLRTFGAERIRYCSPMDRSPLSAVLCTNRVGRYS